MAYEKAPWVPLIVGLAEEEGDLKAEIGIPEDEVVFGRHGGDDSFDILWAQKPWLKPLEINPKSGFCF